VHCCLRYIDALVLVAYFAPCGVAKAGVATLPMIGAITRGLQFLFVARSGTTGVRRGPCGLRG
jgi:1-acyl-sn-glycerol-3-phosphate acyltransferase